MAFAVACVRDNVTRDDSTALAIKSRRDDATFNNGIVLTVAAASFYDEPLRASRSSLQTSRTARRGAAVCFV